MSSTPRAGEKRRLAESDDGAPAVIVKIEARIPPSSCSTASASSVSRSEFPEPASQRRDVETLFTSAEVQAMREKDAKLLRAQCADEYEARILQLKAKHADEKAAAEKEHAETLATALRHNQRHIGEKAELQAEIRSLEEKLKAMQEAAATELIVKPVRVSAITEQIVRQKVEKEFVDEKMKMKQEFRSQIAAKDAEIEKLTGIITELDAKVTDVECETASKKELQSPNDLEHSSVVAMAHDDIVVVATAGARRNSRLPGLTSFADASHASRGSNNGNTPGPWQWVNFDGWSNKKRNWAIRMFRSLRRRNAEISENHLQELFMQRLQKWRD